MGNVDMDWVKDQMTKAKVKQSVGTSVLRLLEVWDTMNHSMTSAEDALEIFSKLAVGHALVEEKAPLDGTWVDAQPGNIRVSEIVRVKTDAFTGSSGTLHNGRVCRVVGVRYGDIICKSIDGREPALEGSHYSPHDLQKLIAK